MVLGRHLEVLEPQKTRGESRGSRTRESRVDGRLYQLFLRSQSASQYSRRYKLNVAISIGRSKPTNLAFHYVAARTRAMETEDAHDGLRLKI